jgi:dinuclear metal center YbgI/SA1388 family protein
MKVSAVIHALRQLAPEHLAETWDKVGLQVGDPGWTLRKPRDGRSESAPPRVMLCIDLTEPVVREAVAAGAAMIVAYHPPIFDPLPKLVATDWKQRLIMEVVQRGVAVYSPHTALDAAAGGINDWLCETVLPGVVAAVTSPEKSATARGGTIRAIRPSNPAKKERPYKLVTYIPVAHLERVRAALFAAGAGSIGDYDQCSFSIEGEGTFRGGESTNPTIGVRGRLERVTERRFETIVPAPNLASVVAALMQAHPYEEPAFDLIRLDLPPSSGGEGVGQGRVVTLDKPITLAQLTAKVKKHLGVKSLEVASLQNRPLRTLGFCAGAGGSLLSDAGEVDAFITGEMRHHAVLGAAAEGKAVILAGHTQTERPYLKVYRRRIMDLTGDQVELLVSKMDRAPGAIR